MGEFDEELYPIPQDTEPVKFSIDLNQYTKSNVGLTRDRIIKEVIDGNEDEVNTFLKARFLRDVSDEVTEYLKEKVTMQAREIKSRYGITFQISSGSKKYKFDHCEQWNKLKEEADKAKQKLEEYQKLMIKAIDFGNVTDEDGVVIPQAILEKQNDDVLKVIIPK